MNRISTGEDNKTIKIPRRESKSPELFIEGTTYAQNRTNKLQGTHAENASKMVLSFQMYFPVP